ncbi:STAS/SEC14 domain-containing protein [Arthrobacter sp. B0490]|uniref:DUF7793 family protein n=1 Tax=Arthrobacter sp. B0490 TaxID=2058891 RepID=UPI0011B0105E|nr:STAS/SEC14 domain-containing protein [Arthrobacter sp. B0490]
MFTASADQGVLRLEWEPGIHIEYADAVEAALALSTLQSKERLTLQGGERMPLLVRIVGVRGVSPEARAGMNAYQAYSKVALVGDNPMGPVIAGFSRRSPTPTRYFTREDRALLWLMRRPLPAHRR